MSKIDILELWDGRYPGLEEVNDYTGRKMLKSACGNPNSSFHPTLDHKRPLSKGGCDVKENIEICHRDTNEEKGDNYTHFKTNGKSYRVERIRGSRTAYKIVKI